MLGKLRLVASHLLILLGVPAFGIAASFVVKSELFRFDLSRTLMALSFFATGYALALVALIYLAAAACGQQRHRLATVFRIVARLVPLILAVLILMDAVILIAGVALVELRLLNSVTTSFMITIVAAAVFALIEMVSSSVIPSFLYQ
jgi:hypothetical protein